MHSKRRRMVGATQTWLKEGGVKLNGKDVKIVQSTLCLMGPEPIRDGEEYTGRVNPVRWVAREPMPGARMGCRSPSEEVATVLRREDVPNGDTCWYEMEQIEAKSSAGVINGPLL